MCSHAASPNWPYTTSLASRVGNCTPPDHPFAFTCPLICIRLDQSFASDLTTTLGGHDWQKSTDSVEKVGLPKALEY